MIFSKKGIRYMAGIIALCAVALLSACGLLQPSMSNSETEERLQELYGEEFVVVSSKPFSTDNIFRGKIYIVSPKGEPEFTFYTYSFLRGRTGGVPGVNHSLVETYIVQKIQAQIDIYAKEENLEYTTKYHTYLSKERHLVDKETEPFTDITNTFIVTPKTVEDISDKLSKILDKILEDDLFSNNMVTRNYLEFYYYVDGKENHYYRIPLFAYDWDTKKKEFIPIDITPAGIRKMITG